MIRIRQTRAHVMGAMHATFAQFILYFANQFEFVNGTKLSNSTTFLNYDFLPYSSLDPTLTNNQKRKGIWYLLCFFNFLLHYNM